MLVRRLSGHFGRTPSRTYGSKIGPENRTPLEVGDRRVGRERKERPGPRTRVEGQAGTRLEDQTPDPGGRPPVGPWS